MVVTDIFNAALAELGEERINDADDTDYRAILCRERWSQARRITLADFEWSTAIRRRTLALVSGEDNLTHYDYMYQLPTEPECIRPLTLLDPTDEYRPFINRQYLIEGEYLYSFMNPLALRYVTDITNLDVLAKNPPMIDALAFQLASKIGYKLTQSAAVVNKMYSLYAISLTTASGHDAEGRMEDRYTQMTSEISVQPDSGVDTLSRARRW